MVQVRVHVEPAECPGSEATPRFSVAATSTARRRVSGIRESKSSLRKEQSSRQSTRFAHFDSDVRPSSCESTMIESPGLIETRLRRMSRQTLSLQDDFQSFNSTRRGTGSRVLFLTADDPAHQGLERQEAFHFRHRSSNAMGRSTEPITLSVARGSPTWKLSILRVMRNRWFYTLLAILTLYIIFEDDIKRAALPPRWDLPLESIIAAIFFFFVAEMTLSSLVKPGYFLGFYFWMDGIATASLFFEIPSIRVPVLGNRDEYACLNVQDSFLAWVGYRAFIGGKAVRVARIFRLLRLLRLFQLYHEIERRRLARQLIHQELHHRGLSGEEFLPEKELTMLELEIMQDMNKETRVGQRLEELTIRRVIVYVLIMVIFLPAFDVEYGIWGTYTGADRGGLRMLHDMAVASGGVPTYGYGVNGTDTSFTAALVAFQETSTYKLGPHNTSQLFFLHLHNTTLVSQPPNTPRRYDELYYMSYTSYTPSGCGGSNSDGDLRSTTPLGPTRAPPPPPPAPGAEEVCTLWYSIGVYDWKWYSQMAAILNILRSFFLICLFALGSYFLHRDSRKLVIKPIERMLQRLQAMAENPLASALTSNTISWKERLDERKEALGQLDCKSPDSSTFASTGTFSLDDSVRSLKSQVSQKLNGQMAGIWQRSTGGDAPQKPGRLATIRSAVSSTLKRGLTYIWDGNTKEEERRAAGEQEEDGYETQILEDSLMKIGALLAVGFGDAGAEIIAENIRKDGDINPMLPGHKMVAVFGFCDVRRFTDATEVLQEEVMEFVNSIAHIVHTSVTVHGGAANKNIGDAFLLVWKLPEGFNMHDVTILRTPDNMIHTPPCQSPPSGTEVQPSIDSQSETGDMHAFMPQTPAPTAKIATTGARPVAESSSNDDAWGQCSHPGLGHRLIQWTGLGKTDTDQRRHAHQHGSGLGDAAPGRKQQSHWSGVGGVSMQHRAAGPAAIAESVLAEDQVAGLGRAGSPHPAAVDGADSGCTAAATEATCPVERQSLTGVLESKNHHHHHQQQQQQPKAGTSYVDAASPDASLRGPPRLSVGCMEHPDIEQPAQLPSTAVAQSGIRGSDTGSTAPAESSGSHPGSAEGASSASGELQLPAEPKVHLPDGDQGTEAQDGGQDRAQGGAQGGAQRASTSGAQGTEAVAEHPHEHQLQSQTSYHGLVPPPSLGPSPQGSGSDTSSLKHLDVMTELKQPFVASVNSLEHSLCAFAPIRGSLRRGLTVSASARIRRDPVSISSVATGDSYIHGFPRSTSLRSARYPASFSSAAPSDIYSVSVPGTPTAAATVMPMVVPPSTLMRRFFGGTKVVPLPPGTASPSSSASASTNSSLQHPSADKDPQAVAAPPISRLATLTKNPELAEDVRHQISDLIASSRKALDSEELKQLSKLTSVSARSACSEEEKGEIIQLIADNALASFVVIHAAVKRSTRLWRYTQREDMNRRMPGYEVQMGFGLHIGWAIEGAIGSEYKIDASYLSPNVNMAARLEAATKQFGVSLLLSEDFVHCLSPAVRKKVRQIDCVTVKGSTQPMGLFTYDVSLDRIPEPFDVSQIARLGRASGEGMPRTDSEATVKEEELLREKYKDVWEENPDLLHTWGIDEQFKSRFDEGFQAYQEGEWSLARDILEECLFSRTNLQGCIIRDVPSEVLLTFMGGHDFVAPRAWMGFRELTEK